MTLIWRNSPALPLHQHQAYGPNGSPEHGARTSAQCQCQSSCAGYTEQLCDEHVVGFISTDIPRIECADKVDQLGEAFEHKRAGHGDSCSHEPQDDVDLQHCQPLPKEVEDQAHPECERCFATKG